MPRLLAGALLRVQIDAVDHLQGEWCTLIESRAEENLYLEGDLDHSGIGRNREECPWYRAGVRREHKKLRVEESDYESELVVQSDLLWSESAPLRSLVCRFIHSYELNIIRI